MRLASLITLLILIGLIAQAHEAHNKSNEVAEKIDSKPEVEKLFAQINTKYLKSVKPIFQKSCTDCHSSSTRYPWYSEVPGIKQLLQSDIAEAKTHLDVSNGFPFNGHGSPAEDLEAIGKAVADGSMPPFRYRTMHPSSKLTDVEKMKVKEWVDQSLKLIQN